MGEHFSGHRRLLHAHLSQSELCEDGYQHRAAVTLTETPSLPLRDQGWTVETLHPGDGGEKLMGDWLGWKMGREYMIQNGGLVSKDAAKL
jgi:alpha-methylacyl-CoA racemase